MPWFGNQDHSSASYQGLCDWIEGAAFTFTDTGSYPVSMSAYLKTFPGLSRKCKLAIYRLSDLALLAVTEEKALSGSMDWQWVTFNIVGSPPLLVPGTDYILTAWAERSIGDNDFAVSIGVKDQVGELDHEQNIVYTGTFPDPYVDVPQLYDEILAIYCTHAAPGAYLFFRKS